MITTEELRKRTFLQNYLSFMEWQESPRDFHFWTALTLIAAATRRKIFLDRVYYNLYPNLYSGVVAESAWCRKSTAMDIGMKLFMQVFPDYPTLMGKITPEELISCLSDDPHLFIQADELGVFLSKFMIQNGILDLLTSLYMKGKVEYRTKTKGTFLIENSYVNILSGGVPSYIQKRIGDAFEEGFVGRFTFVHREERERRIARPEIVVDVEYLKTVWNVLKEQLLRIADYSGEVIYSKEAGDEYDRWYNALPEKKAMESESALSGYKGRIGDHVLKFSILMLLAEFPSKLELTERNIKDGIRIAEDSDKSLISITRDLKKDIFHYQSEIEEILRDTKRILRTILFARYRKRLTPSEFDMVIWSLLRSGMIVEEKQGRNVYYTFNTNCEKEEKKNETFTSVANRSGL